MVIQEERQRKLGSSINHNLVAAVPTTNTRPKKMRPTCSNCHKPGHLKEKCYFLHGFPPGYGDKRRNDDKPKANINLATDTNQTGSTTMTPPIIDATASNASIQSLISLLSQQL